MCPNMIDWLSLHGATLLIFAGGVLATVAAFVAERRATTKTVERRKGFWPSLIAVGAVVGITGSVWAGYQQDRIGEYLTGGDGYGQLNVGVETSSSIRYFFSHSGELPLYDVSLDIRDATKANKLALAKGLNPNYTYSGSISKPTPVLEDIISIESEVVAHVTLGNVGPSSTIAAWVGPIPESDDQRYDVSIWSRNGYFTQEVLLHRIGSGWSWATKVWRTDRTSMNGIPKKSALTEFVSSDFPREKVDW
jgi:hypothetical protein